MEEISIGKIELPKRRSVAGVVRTEEGYSWFVEREAEGKSGTYLDALGDLCCYLVKSGAISTVRRLLADERNRTRP